MTYEQLKEKALSLPLAPGVYIMRDKNDTVIYVGKAKKLKNRVSQYFQDTASHSPKTRIMVSKIDHFDVIIAATEFEALVLECSQIKQYQPRYNILLKDDKGYPYLRLNMKEAYPVITMVSKPLHDGAEYFGPFGSRGVTNNLLKAIVRTLKLPDCGKKFPKDIGKGRPCLNYHMGQCAGWCTGKADQALYRETMMQARQLLSGNYKAVAAQIRKDMDIAAQDLQFEQAATLRDRYIAVETLGKKQLVTAAAGADTDVIGYAQTETKAGFAVLHYQGGALLDKEYEVFDIPDDAGEAVSGLLKQFYLNRGFAPKQIYLPFELEDSAYMEQFLQEKYAIRTRIRVPLRGEKAHLVELANTNALEEAQRQTGKEEKINASLTLLGKMLSIPTPQRIESYDISNISGTDIVGAMVVFQQGKPKKSDYKRFKLENMAGQDDYGSMRQVLQRRFAHLKAGDAGFNEMPDILLIDGGVTHACVALEVLQETQLDIPVFGMVKDDRHRTRALVTPQGMQINIDTNQAVFALIGNIQEETHRFAITYHKKLRSRRLRKSKLDGIDGIGPKRKEELLKTFGSVAAIKDASVAELERILPRNAAIAVYDHFHQEGEG